jgi:hypothetical protein
MIDGAAAVSQHTLQQKAKLTVNVGLDLLVRQHRPAIDVNLVGNGHVVAQHRHVLQARPAADGAVPAHDGALDPRVVLYLAPAQQHAALQPHAVADDHVGPDGDVWADAAVLADLGRRVHEHVAAVHVGARVWHELLGALLGQAGQVQAGAGQKVLGLADVHPEAVEVERVQLAGLAHVRERLFLDAGRAQLDALQHAGVEHVDAGVDPIADELDGLLDEAVDARDVARLVHDDAVLAGLVNLGHDDGALVTVRAVEGGQLLEGVVADDVAVEHEEGRRVLGQRALGELERAGGAEGLGFDGEFNLDAELLFVLAGLALASLRGRSADLFEVLGHDLRAVIDGEHDVGDAGFGEGGDLVLDHGLVGELDERLGQGEGLLL